MQNTPETKSLYLAIHALAWVLSATLLYMVIKLSINSPFDHDEFEAIKSAWKITHGKRIYIDFFQHHHPFLYYLLVPLIDFFGETRATLHAARALILGFSLASLVIVYFLAKEIYSRHAASIAVFFTFALGLFFDKATEIRPDVPQMFFGLLAIFLLFRYFKHRQRVHLVLSALSLMLGFLFLQKLLILIIALVGLMAWRVYRGQEQWRTLFLYIGLLVICGLVYGAYLAYTDQLRTFLFFNYTYNLTRLDQQQHQTGMLYRHFSQFNGALFFCLLLGITSRKNREQIYFVVITLFLLAFALLYRTQWLQYYIVVFPMIAIVAAGGWFALVSRHTLAGVVCLIAAFVYANVYYSQETKRSNSNQLSRIDYVVKNTTANDYVYDGDIQFNLYRKDMDFFWFGIRNGALGKYQKMTGYTYDVYALIEKYRPKIINVKTIPDRNHSAIRDHYTKSSTYKHFYVRKQ